MDIPLERLKVKRNRNGVFYCCEEIYEQESDIMDIDDLKDDSKEKKIKVMMVVLYSVLLLLEILMMKPIDVHYYVVIISNCCCYLNDICLFVC